MTIQRACKQMVASLHRTMQRLTARKNREGLEWTLGWTPHSDSVATDHIADNAVYGIFDEPLDNSPQNVV